jgi:O-antigen/teichoic acid export membrane protein
MEGRERPRRDPVTKRRIAVDSLVYSIGQFSGRATQVLLVPILTRALHPGAYAVTDVVIAYSQSLMLLLVFGLDGALARYFYEVEDHEVRAEMVSTSLSFRLLISLPLAIAVWLAAGPLATFGLGDATYAKYIRIAASTLPFTLVALFTLDVLRVTFQPWKFVTVSLIQTVLTTALSIVFVIERDAGVVGVLYGRLIGDGVASLAGLVLIRHAMRAHLNLDWLRKMLSYGGPMVPGIFAFGWISSVDRWALQRWRGLDDVAQYAVAMKFFALVSFVVSAFNLAFAPHAFAQSRQPGSAMRLARQIEVLALLVFGAALAAALTAPAIVAVLAPSSYSGADRPAVWLSFAAAAWGLFAMFSIPVALSLRTGWLTIAAFAGAALASVAHATATARWGPEGAAIATFIGHVTAATVSGWFAARLHPIPLRHGRLAVAGFSALVLAVAVAAVAPPGIGGAALRGLALIGWTALSFLLFPGWVPDLRGSRAASKPTPSTKETS